MIFYCYAVQVLPKYFQLAEVVDSPVDFYSSRVPKKQRKRTMAEEIMHDEETLRWGKWIIIVSVQNCHW